MDVVSASEAKFRPAEVQHYAEQDSSVSLDRRDCLFLRGAADTVQPLIDFLRRNVKALSADLTLEPQPLKIREAEIACYRDGGHFVPHIDTTSRSDHVRILSCVYYFSAIPRRFSGGQLRLFPMPSIAATTVPFVEIEPEADSLVIFPSWTRHEVRPVAVPSNAWLDNRFSINCWLHRAAR